MTFKLRQAGNLGHRITNKPIEDSDARGMESGAGRAGAGPTLVVQATA